MTLNFAEAVPLTSLKILDHIVQYYHPTLDPSRKVWDLTPLVQEIKWTDDMNQAATQMDIRLGHQDNLKTIIKNGGIITLFGPLASPDGGNPVGEVFRGVVFETTISTQDNAAMMTITAFDHMHYLLKNEDSLVFHDQTASEVIKTICAKIAMPIGAMPDTVYKIPRLVFRKDNYYDMMIVALSESRWVDGQRFILRVDKGALNLYKKNLPPKVWYFEYGKNIFAATLSKSIEAMRNKVIIFSTKTQNAIDDIVALETGDTENTALAVVAGDDNDPIEDTQKIADYGLMQHVETGTTPERFLDAREYAQHLLETLSKVKMTGRVHVPNINSVRWGDAVNIMEPLSGLGGQFYVTSGTHTITPDGATMELSLAFEDLLPDMLMSINSNAEDAANAMAAIMKEEGITRRPSSTNSNVRSQDKTTGIVFSLPLDDPYSIFQQYGANAGTPLNAPTHGHSGLDMANGSGTYAINKPVYACASGKVTRASFDDIGGNMIIIRHNDGAATVVDSWYAHLSAMRVAQGDTVTRGELIGLVGQTGSADPRVNPGGGPHLHFQMQRNGVTVDPHEYVTAIHY